MQSILDFEKQTSFSVTATVENKDGGKLVEMIEVVIENENEAPKVKSRYIANNSKRCKLFVVDKFILRREQFCICVKHFWVAFCNLG